MHDCGFFVIQIWVLGLEWCSWSCGSGTIAEAWVHGKPGHKYGEHRKQQLWLLCSPPPFFHCSLCMPSRFIDSVPFANDLVLLLGAFWDQQAQAPRLLGHEILDASNGLYRVFLGNPFLLMAAVTFVCKYTWNLRQNQNIVVCELMCIHLDRCLKGTYSLMEWIYGKIVDMLTVSIRIMDDEEIYDRVSDYVARYELMKDSRLLRHADAKAKSKEPEKRWFSMHDDDTPPLLPELTLVPRNASRLLFTL